MKRGLGAAGVVAACLLPAVGVTVLGSSLGSSAGGSTASGSTASGSTASGSSTGSSSPDMSHDAHGGHEHHGTVRGLAAARAATARFTRLATAEKAGYARLPAPAPLHECIDEDVDLNDRDGKPAMGIHWVNGALLDATIDVRKPEVLVYEPKRNGRLDLVAVEYVVFEADWGARGTRPAPRLFGESFMYVPAPNRYDLPAFYALHAWVWKHNPDGALENMNPWVTCRYASKVATSAAKVS